MVLAAFQPLAAKLQLENGKHARPELRNESQQGCYNPFPENLGLPSERCWIRTFETPKVNSRFSNSRLLPCVEGAPMGFTPCVTQGKKHVAWRENEWTLWLKETSSGCECIRPEWGRWGVEWTLGRRFTDLFNVVIIAVVDMKKSLEINWR